MAKAGSSLRVKVSTRLRLSRGSKACLTTADRLGKNPKSPALLTLSCTTPRLVETVPRVFAPLIPTRRPGLIVVRKLLILSVELIRKLSL